MDRYKTLRDVRYQNGNLTQKEIAEKIGISIGAYNLIESGKRHGSTRTWARIQSLFGLSDAEVWKMQSNKQQ